MIKSKLITANIDDSHFIFKLYNLGVKDKNFKRTKLITYTQHIKWLKETLNKNKSIIYICKFGPKKVGYIKFSQLSKISTKISIIINKEFRSTKLSSLFMKKACDKYFKKTKCKKIYAEVLKKNTISQNFFLKNNFKFVKKNKVFQDSFNKKNYLYLNKK